MRFMMFMYPNITDEEWVPDPEAVSEMTAYNEQLTQAGVLLAADGLHPGGAAVSVTVQAGKKKITDGPYAEAKEVVGGYWILQTKTREEAVEWASRVPIGEGPRVELRQIFELSDFPQEVQDAARLSKLPPEQTSDAS